MIPLYAWFDSGYMHCRIWQLIVLVCAASEIQVFLDLLESTLYPLYPAVFGVSFGPTVDRFIMADWPASRSKVWTFLEVTSVCSLVQQ